MSQLTNYQLLLLFMRSSTIRHLNSLLYLTAFKFLRMLNTLCGAALQLKMMMKARMWTLQGLLMMYAKNLSLKSMESSIEMTQSSTHLFQGKQNTKHSWVFQEPPQSKMQSQKLSTALMFT